MSNETAFKDKMTKEWEQILTINYILENASDGNEDNRSIWKNPYENFKGVFGREFDGKTISDLNIDTKIDIYGLPVSDLKPLQKFNKIKELYIGCTNVKELDDIFYHTELEKLCCYNTPIQKINSLENLTKLKILCISKTNIENISSLSKLSELRKISLYKTKIKDLSPLRNLRNLEKVNFNFTRVSSLEPLYNLRKLKEVHCFSTNVSEQEVNKLKKILPKCKVYKEYEEPEGNYDDFA